MKGSRKRLFEIINGQRHTKSKNLKDKTITNIDHECKDTITLTRMED